MRTLLLLLLALPAAAAPGDTADLGLYPVTIDGRMGYIDRTGTVVIEPQFDQASAFFEGRAQIEVGRTKTPEGAYRSGTYGYIDRTGKVVIPAIYRSARPFHEGRGQVDVGRMDGYVDPDGTLVIPAKFERALNFHEGRAAVEVTRGRWAYIDRAGEIVFWVPPDADMSDPSDFSEGHVAIEFRQGARRGTRYHDRQGKVVLEIPHDIARDLSEGLIAVRDKAKSAWGFMDIKGQWVLPPTYRFAWGFKGGRAVVSVDEGREQFIDRTGKVLLEADDLGNPQEGRIQIRRDHRIGFRDEAGAVVIEPTWGDPMTHLSQFHGGLAQVKRPDAPGEVYIDRDGKVVWPAPKK